MYHEYSSHSSTEGTIGCFYFQAVMNKVTINMDMQVSLY